MRSIRKHLVTAASAISGLAFMTAVRAQGLGAGTLEEVGKEAGVGTGNQLPIIIGNLVRAAISVLGIIFLILLIFGGFLWMTARGEATQVDKAKQTITRAAIGLAIIVMSYAITSFVLSRLVTATG